MILPTYHTFFVICHIILPVPLSLRYIHFSKRSSGSSLWNVSSKGTSPSWSSPWLANQNYIHSFKHTLLTAFLNVRVYPFYLVKLVGHWFTAKSHCPTPKPPSPFSPPVKKKEFLPISDLNVNINFFKVQSIVILYWSRCNFCPNALYDILDPFLLLVNKRRLYQLMFNAMLS